MCQLLIRVVDKQHHDKLIDIKQTKRGTVVVVAPDVWSWGKMELTNPDWRILRWPSVSEKDAEVMTGREYHQVAAFGAPKPRDDKLLQPRAFLLNLDAEVLPAEFQEYLADATRKVPAFDMPEGVTLDMLKTRVTPITEFRSK